MMRMLQFKLHRIIQVGCIICVLNYVNLVGKIAVRSKDLNGQLGEAMFII